MSTTNIIPFPGTSANAAVSSSTSGNTTSSSGGSGNGGSPSSDPHAWTRQQVWAIRYHKKFNEDQKRRILHNFITTHENRKTSHGAFLRTPDKRAYLFDGRVCRLYRIDERDPDFGGYLIQAYGLNTTEQITRHLISSLRNSTISMGLYRDVRRFSYWDRGGQKLYISRYDGTCYEIDGYEVKIRPNGYGPAVFLDDDGGYNCDVPQKTGPEVGNHHELFKQLIDDLQYVPATVGGMSPATQKTCLGIWMFAIAFPDLLPTKPLLLVEGERGSGKCLGKGTPVLMRDGTVKPVEDVAEGEFVMGPDSQPRRVAGVSRGRGPLYKIIPTKGDSWVCNEDHILTVVLRGRMNKHDEWIDHFKVIDVPLKDCAPHEDGTRVKGRSPAMLLRAGVEFPSREVPVDPYLVGLWLGDGTVTHPEITSNDDEILKYCEEIAPTYGVYVRVKTDARNGVRAAVFTTGNNLGQQVVGRNPLRTFFPTLVVDGQKRIPQEYLRNDAHKRRELLAGLIDTDGYYDRNDYEIVTKHAGLRDDILYLARSLGLAAYAREKTSTIKSSGFEGIYHRITISGHLDQIPCKLPRKQAKPRQQPKNVLHTGFVIEPIGEGDYYGFTLDGDGRFLLGDFTVTHNTFALQRIAMTLHGKSVPLTIPKKEDPDFGIKILRSPIAIIDDVNDPVEWLRDTLCTYATGGAWARRKLFTDDSELVIKPNAFLAITTNNPQTFRQGQVADRCLILRLERREEKDGYAPADQLLDKARYWRPELQGEWLYWLNEIVRELQKPQTMSSSRYRMADFAHLAHLIGRVLNQPAGPPGDWSPEAIEEMLGGMQAERDALVIEGDAMIDLIDKWLDVVSNQGRELRVADLHRELAAIAKAGGNVTFFKSSKALAARLREASSALGQHFDITRRTGPGGVMLYTFRRA